MRLLEYSMAGGLAILGASLLAVGHLVSVGIIPLLSTEAHILGLQFKQMGFILVSVGLSTGSMMFVFRKLRLL
jgi:hypothetical protein